MVRPEGPVTIGADGTGTNTFQGYISQLSIEPGSVSSDEVSRRYEATRLSDIPSLGDDDFEETDPDSKFTLSPSMKPIIEKREPFTLSATTANFNDAPLSNGGTICQEVEGDFVVMCRFDDMEGYRDHSAKSYNDGGLLIADADGSFTWLAVVDGGARVLRRVSSRGCKALHAKFAQGGQTAPTVFDLPCGNLDAVHPLFCAHSDRLLHVVARSS